MSEILIPGAADPGPPETFQPSRPLPWNLKCVRKTYHEPSNPGVYPASEGYHLVTLIDTTTHVVEMHRLPEKYQPPGVSHVMEDRQRYAAFVHAEQFISTVRTHAEQSYRIWTAPLHTACPHDTIFDDTKHPYGATVSFPGPKPFNAFRMSEAAPTYEGLRFRPGVYRVIRPPYWNVGHAVVDLLSQSEPYFVATRVEVAAVEVQPDWGAGLATVPGLVDRDPDLWRMLAAVAGNGFSAFDLDGLAEFVLDRGFGKWIEQKFYETVVLQKAMPAADFPVQYFADAIHAIAHHCRGATGRVAITEAVRAANELREAEEKTHGPLPGYSGYPDDWGTASHP